eukprot:3766799-Prorocentrum_lima.AAC.1
MTSSLVGSEMCIRDSKQTDNREKKLRACRARNMKKNVRRRAGGRHMRYDCLLYTSDAADDM